MKNLRILMLLFIVFLISLPFGLLAERYNVKDNTLFFSSSDTTFHTGSFVLQWNAPSSFFAIYQQIDPLHIIWESLPRAGFIAAEYGQMQYSEKAGSFDIQDKTKSEFHLQVITGISSLGDSIIIAGYLLNRKSTDSIGYQMTWKSTDSSSISFNVVLLSPKANRIFLTYASDADEVIAGFGEQPSHFNHKGNKVPVLVQEQGIGRGDIKDPLIKLVLGASAGNDYSSYISVPQYITSKNKSLFLENYEYSEFDFRQSQQVQIKLFGNNLQGKVLYGKSPLDLLTTYTAYSGRMRPLPNWISKGAVVGLQGGTDKVYSVLKRLSDVGTPISAFWLQDWVGQRKTIAGKQLWWNWTLDTLRYPRWNFMKDSLALKGISLMGYVNPFLVDVSLDQLNPNRKNYFKEAEEKGFLVKNEEGKTYKISNGTLRSSLIDLSNPACRDWMKSIIKNEMLHIGLRGWMADFAEALPFDARLYSGEKTTLFHNRYTEAWGQLNREAIEEAGLGDDIVFFMRSGYSKSPGFSTLFWAGDQSANWGKNDGIRSALTCIINSGFSGFSLNHSDIGGFVSIHFPIAKKITRDEEVLNRWIEMSAFHTVFRTHEGVNPEVNVQVYDHPRIAGHFAFFAKVYASWDFYRQELMLEASQKGWPVIRHPSIVFPEDNNCWHLGMEQFMVGNEWMVAPVLTPNTESVEMYLPAGQWINLWTGELQKSFGQNFTISGLKSRPAVFYQEGSTVTEKFKAELLKHGIQVP